MLVGTAAAQQFVARRFVAALVVALALQVGVNYANDYFDGLRGIDTHKRVGPRRAVASGLVAPARMRLAMLVAFAIAGIAGLTLVAAVRWELILVGLACMAAAVAYSGGPRPYASAGLGELFVFMFFGLVATVGSAYVQDEEITLVAVAASIPMGLLAAAVLVANNARDLVTDRVVGKRTLAVRLGLCRTGILYAVLVVAAIVSLATIALLTASVAPLVAILSLPLAVRPLRLLTGGVEGASLLPALAGTVRFMLAFALLLAAGLLFA